MKKQTKKKSKTKQTVYQVRISNSSGKTKQVILSDYYEAWDFYGKVSSILELLDEEGAWVSYPLEIQA